MGLSGWVFVAAAVIVLGYLVPHLVRAREIKVESRVDDRFSEALRLVEVGTPDAHSGNSSSSIHVSGRQRTEALAMIRPTAPRAARVNARELAASRAACAAEISRRAAAARRRAVVLGLLVTATVVVGILGATPVVHAAWALIPAALLAGAGYLSVVAEKQRRVADARTRSQMHRLDQRLRMFRSEAAETVAPEPVKLSFDEIVTGGAHAPQILPDAEPRHARVTVSVDERSAEERAESRRAVREATSWTPAPVPAPTYTLKQEAPRRTAAPAETVDEGADEISVSVPERPTHVVAARRGESDADAVASVASVNAVLARRRASGM